jgi:hypothetical protein
LSSLHKHQEPGLDLWKVQFHGWGWAVISAIRFSPLSF